MGADGQSLPFIAGDTGAECGGGNEVDAGSFLAGLEPASATARACFPRALQGSTLKGVIDANDRLFAQIATVLYCL